LGVQPLDWVRFPDHHHYRPAELKLLSRSLRDAGARVLVTTEKDAINLCEGFADLLAPLPLFYLKIGLEIAREDELLEEIERRSVRATEAGGR
jgi:tetraacyldisaccharide-1-P 4'-kinase